MAWFLVSSLFYILDHMPMSFGWSLFQLKMWGPEWNTISRCSHRFSLLSSIWKIDCTVGAGKLHDFFTYVAVKTHPPFCPSEVSWPFLPFPCNFRISLRCFKKNGGCIESADQISQEMRVFQCWVLRSFSIKF